MTKTKFRITRVRHHPWTKQAGIIVSVRQLNRWQLVQSLFGPSLESPEIVRFEQWARERYPQAQVKEV